MLFNDNESVNEQEDHLQATENKKPNAYRVDDDSNVEEKDLKRSFIYGSDENKTGTEGQPVGGGNFGKNNQTPSGDDKNNPSQNAGYSNQYFRRTEPSDEHPEDTNFKSADQDGSPKYDKAQVNSDISNEMPKPEKIERGNGENDRPHKGESYQEGTDDNDGNDQANIPGPEELPDQQKVGEPDPGNTDERDHIET
jgi:hypothetical protein